MIDGMGSLCYDVDVCYYLVRTLSPFRYLPLPLYRLGKGRVDYLWGAKSKISVVL